MLHRLAPLIALALTASAPAAQALAECRLSPADGAAGFGTLTVTASKEAEEGPRHRVSRRYAIPDGLTVFGLKPAGLESLETRERGNERIVLVTMLDAPFADVEAAVLAGHGLSKCEFEVAGSVCGVFSSETAGHLTTLVIQRADGVTKIGCNYPLDSE